MCSFFLAVRRMNLSANISATASREVTFRKICHACFLATVDGASVLFDPWFGAPINHGTFHAYPKMSVPTAEELDSVVAVHISHIHDDHFQPDALAILPKNVPILIGDYEKKNFRSAIEKLGFTNIIEMSRDFEETKIGPFSFYHIPKSVNDGSFDSSIVLKAGGRPYYIANDCIHPAFVYKMLHQIFGSFEGAFVGYTTINSMTWCTDYSECLDFSLPLGRVGNAEFRQSLVWEHVRLVAKTLSPKWIAPYSSDYRFLNRDLAYHNRLFGLASEIFHYDIGESRPVLLAPGDTFTGEHDEKVGRRPWPETSPAISDADLLPAWLDRSCTVSEFEKVADDARSYFQQVFERQMPRWRLPMSIEIQVQADGLQPKVLRYSYVGGVIQDNTTDAGVDRRDEPDLILEYPASLLRQLFNGRWNPRSFHVLFCFRARWRRIKLGQMNMLEWV